jgi:radical SAM protein with 4Fe4S-binding SPASM domain
MLTVYFKPTNYCNVGCEHCYLPESTREMRDRMSLEKVREVAHFLAQASKTWRDPHVNIIWHGGEPLVLPPDYFFQVGEIFDELLPGHTEGIQTSLMPYSDKYAEVINKRFGGGIGSSVDFEARKLNGTAENYQTRWLKKVELARKNGHDVGLLITPAKSDLHLVKERMDWLESNAFEFFNFERYNSFGQVLKEKPSNKEHSIFLMEVIDYLLVKMKEGKNVPMIPVIAAVLGGIKHALPGDRWGGSCQHDFLVIEPDGSLNNCPDKASFEPAYANVSDGVAAFQNSPSRKKWIRIQQVGHRISDCATCENNLWCKSGCPITPNADPHGDETECSGYKTFINHVRGLLEDPINEAILMQYKEGGFTPSWMRGSAKENSLTT